MNAAKHSGGWKNALAAGLSRLMPGSGGGRLIVVLIVAAVLLIVPFWAWRKWGKDILAGSSYLLSPENIEVTAQPDWIKVDVKTEVIRDNSLANFRITDPEVNVKVAAAFTLHPWVEEVQRVRKRGFPARVIVELKYRQPAAWVEVVVNEKPGLLPIDPSGVLLPTEGFSQQDTRDFLRIQVGNSRPIGQPGTSWGDERVAEAALIAVAWRRDWKQLDLYRIAAMSESDTGNLRSQSNQYEIITRGDNRVLWGSPPGKEASGEASAADKITRLMSYARENGGLDSAGRGIVIDARDGKGLSTQPRTAKLP